MNKKIGTYMVVGEVENRYILQCEECGKKIEILKDKIESFETIPCNCMKKYNKLNLTHGMSKTITYSSWLSMKSRCNEKNNARYDNYGGRGIKVCDRWLHSFENFLEDMGERPSKEYTLDRIDVNGDYCKENCRWADYKTQANNTTRNINLEYNGEVHTIAEWSEILGIKYGVLRDRIANGWSVERALSYQGRKKKEIEKKKYEDFLDRIDDISKRIKTIKNLIGVKFGSLTVVALLKKEDDDKHTKWLCSCDCGNYVELGYYSIINQTRISCGCTKKKNIKRDMPEYNAWCGMKARCFNKNHPRYDRYGGRGITVCERWKNSFDNFLEDMGAKPDKSYSLDRIDVNGDYCKENCRWANDKTQANNTTKNIYIEYKGKLKTVSEWAEIYGISAKTITWRYNAGWELDDVFNAQKYRRKEKIKKDKPKLKLNPRMKDMTGETYGNIFVISYHGERVVGKQKKVFWNCRCSCGNVFVANGAEIRNGHTTSCGCGVTRMNKLNAHKMNNTLEYRSWNNMKQMCDNEKNPSYKNYGAKGIKYCEEWSDFRKFFEDMGNRPVKNASLARYDETKDFCKENCYWKFNEKK